MKSDVSALVHMFELGKTFNKEKSEKPTSSRRRSKPEDDFDLVAEYLKQQAKADKLKKAIESIERINKKEEKKEEKKSGMSAPQLAMWMIATFPITGPLYFYYVSMLIKTLQ